MRHLNAVVARPMVLSAVLILGTVLFIPGCTPSQIREQTIAQLDRAEQNLDAADRALGVLVEYRDSDLISMLPSWARDLIGKALPETATIAEYRAFLLGAKAESLTQIEDAKASLARIDDGDTEFSAWTQFLGAIAPVVAPFAGPAAPWVLGIGTIAAGVGRVTGKKKGVTEGAAMVAQNIAIGAAADPALKAAMKSGPANAAMKVRMATLPKQVQDAVNKNKATQVTYTVEA